jgi:hypothetical protein
MEIMTPKWADFILTAYIPCGKTYVLVLDSFYIETWNRNALFMGSDEVLISYLYTISVYTIRE